MQSYSSIQKLWAQKYAHNIAHKMQDTWPAHLQEISNLIRPAIAAWLQKAAPFTMPMELQFVLELDVVDMAIFYIYMFGGSACLICNKKLSVLWLKNVK